MNGPEKEDHWKALVEDIGAQPVEKPAEPSPTETVQQAEPAAPRVARPAKPKPRPATRKPSDWNALASKLGIEVPDAEPVAKEADEPETSQTEDDATAVGHASSADDQRESDSLEPLEVVAAEAEEDDTVDRVEFFEPDDEHERDTVDLAAVDSHADSFAAGLLTDMDENASDDHVDDLTEIDDEDVKQKVETESDRATPPRKRRRRGRRRTETEPTTDENEEAVAANDAERDTSTDDEVESTGESDSKTRSRRRRRRKTSRRAKGSEQDSDTASKDVAEGTSQDDASSEDAKERSPKHRKIPTWEESVSIIVDSNLAARNKSSTSKSTGRNSGRRRGRGRTQK